MSTTHRTTRRRAAPRRRRGRYAVAAGVLVAVVVAAVVAVAMVTGAAEDGNGQFDTEGGRAAYPLNCLTHQQQEPGPAYTRGEQADTFAIFKMLEYYTANSGVAGYCDGNGPTDIDRMWAQRYVDLGADRDNVANIIGPQAR